jgi:acyl-CoA dehydrogenase
VSRPAGWMDETHAGLRELAVRFIRSEVLPAHDEWIRAKAMPRSFWTAAGELGLLGCSVPTEYGGGGGDLLHDFVVLEALTRSGVVASSVQVSSFIVPGYFVRYGSREQKATWLPRLCSGQSIGALAMTEPDAGSDLRAIRCRAVRDGDNYRISGSKTFITNGTQADVLLVAARAEPGGDHRGLSLFVIDVRECQGSISRRRLDKLGQHESDTAEVVLDDVVVPASALLGRPGDGWSMLMSQLPAERLACGVNAVAAMELAVDLAVSYANERQAFGKPLLAHQHLKFELAECTTITAVARAFLDSLLARLAHDEPDPTSAAMAKWWLTEMEGDVIDRCLQVFGGYGYMQEFTISRLYANARAQRIYGGSNEIMKELIGRSLLEKQAGG